MGDREDIITQFSNVTGVDHDRARFHLESAAWDLQVAMANFYEEVEHDVDEGSASNSQEVDDFNGDGDVQPRPLNIKPKREPKMKNSRFGTISSLREDEESSSEDEGQAFYAGGSERSGQQILGPSKKKKTPDSVVTDLFQSAREYYHGAEELESPSAPASASQPAFHGTGYRLGETEGPLESVAGPSLARSRRDVAMTLKLWKQGFSIDDGDLRPYDDPSNKEFLDSIKAGEVPQELTRLAKGREVNLNMEDHRTEQFVKSKVAVKAFSGEGHMLGSPAPAVMTTASSGASPAMQPVTRVNIDSSKPVTTIQIRLADGKRMVAKFNLSNTVADIRNHIVASNPQYASAAFALMTTFPNKELTEERQTLEEAKLANAVIVQKMK